MTQSEILQAIKDAASARRIRSALDVIDGINSTYELERLIDDLISDESEIELKSRLFFASHIFERLQKYESAFEFAIKAAEHGLSVGFYRAGLLAEDDNRTIQQPHNAEHYFKKGAEKRHIWCQMEVLKIKSRDSSFLSKATLSLYRFLIAPCVIIASAVFPSMRQRVLY